MRRSLRGASPGGFRFPGGAGATQDRRPISALHAASDGDRLSALSRPGPLPGRGPVPARSQRAGPRQGGARSARHDAPQPDRQGGKDGLQLPHGPRGGLAARRHRASGILHPRRRRPRRADRLRCPGRPANAFVVRRRPRFFQDRHGPPDGLFAQAGGPYGCRLRADARKHRGCHRATRRRGAWYSGSRRRRPRSKRRTFAAWDSTTTSLCCLAIRGRSAAIACCRSTSPCPSGFSSSNSTDWGRRCGSAPAGSWRSSSSSDRSTAFSSVASMRRYLPWDARRP